MSRRPPLTPLPTGDADTPTGDARKPAGAVAATPTAPTQVPRIDPDKKRAALIATAITLPLVVIMALLLGALSGGSSDGPQDGPLPAITAAAPAHAAAETAPCTSLLVALPVQLNSLDPRRVVITPATEVTPFVVAWGDPAVVVSCGVGRPAGFGPGSDAELIEGGGGAFYYVGKSADSEVFTVVDRAAYVSVAIPQKYQGADYLTPVNDAIIKAMPKPVCSTNAAELDVSKLCDRRTD